MSARIAPQRPAGRSDGCGGEHREDLCCDQGRVFVEDGLASVFETVLHASGVELAHENESGADESASSAGEEEAPPPKDRSGLNAAIRATTIAECPTSSSTTPHPDMTTELPHIKSLDALVVALHHFGLDHRWAISQRSAAFSQALARCNCIVGSSLQMSCKLH